MDPTLHLPRGVGRRITRGVCRDRSRRAERQEEDDYRCVLRVVDVGEGRGRRRMIRGVWPGGRCRRGERGEVF